MFTLFACAVLFAAVCFKLQQRPKNFPPGPRGLPLAGYFPFITKWDPYPHKALWKMSKVYGPVTGFFVGPNQPMISVCSHEAIKEAMQNEDLSGRPTNSMIKARTYDEKLGIMFVDGPFWQEQRRFTMRHLRDLGFGKSTIEDQMMDEIRDLIQDIEETSKSDPMNTVDFTNIFQSSVINILWALVAGQRYQRGDPKLRELLDTTDRFFRGGNVLRSSIPVPIFLLRRFPSLRKFVGFHLECIEAIVKFVEKTVEEHKQAKTYEDPHDFIDDYLKQIEETSNKPSTTFTEKQLVSTVLDFFGAGAESTSNTIGFAMIHLIRNQEVQQKVQEELDRVCGDALPSFAHRSQLPYTEAVLLEAQRCSSIAPLTVPHCAMKETMLHGYTIPKDSIILLNLHGVFNDEEYWNDPETFRPERHLNEDGTKVVKNERFYPFGSGKRMCSGESLAKNTYFLFVAALVKTFHFLPLSNELPKIEPTLGFTLGYQGFKAVVKPRHTSPSSLL